MQTLYEGPTTIKQVQEDTFYIRTSQGPDGNAVTCDGDSGDATYNQEKPPRVVDGVNSLADKEKDSWVTDVTRPEVRNFILEQTNNVPGGVCGVNPRAVHCRPLPK